MTILQCFTLVCSGSAGKSFPLHSGQEPLLNKYMYSGHRKTETLLCELYLGFFIFCTTREILHSVALGKYHFLLFQMEMLPPESSLLHFLGSLFVFVPALTSCHEIFIATFAFVQFSMHAPAGVLSTGENAWNEN